MTPARRWAVAAVVLLAVSCGKKGPPLPPLRLSPPAVTDVTARRTPAQVQVRVRVPGAEAGTTLPADRIEIYRRFGDGSETPPDAAALLQSEYLWRSITVTPDDEGALPAAVGSDGWLTAIDQDPIATGNAAAYVAVAVADRDRRGPSSPLVEVPASAAVSPPQGVTVDYDARQLTVTWSPADPGLQFEVISSTPDGLPGALLTPEPIDASSWSTAVSMGREWCVVVRAIQVNGRVVLESPAAGPVCETPVDRFAPPPPANLVAAVAAGGVSLVWSPVAAPDLGGYLVLRGDGPDGTLLRLTDAPIADTSWRDTTVTPGSTYTYAVVAVDRAEPPNVSAESNRQTVTVR